MEVEIPSSNLAWELAPCDIPSVNEQTAIKKAIDNPIGSGKLEEMVEPGMKVVILVDDFTRPTPRRSILKVLMDELNLAGIPDRDIMVIIALGTHRYMSGEEIRAQFGEEIVSRVRIVNHEWMNPDQLIDLGVTANGTPVHINRIAYEADFLIGVGSIVPHCFAGFSGGAKIVQPGISGPDTTAATHFLICRDERKLLHFAGRMRNPVMEEMRAVAGQAGLNFIVNVIFNSKKEIVRAVAGDMVAAHEAGMLVSKDIFMKDIEEKVDIVITEAMPADADMWQATKPFSYARRVLKEGGSMIFVIAAPDGIGNHPFLLESGRCTFQDLREMMMEGRIKDRVACTILMVIKKSTEGIDTYVVSDGLTREEKEGMGFLHAGSVQEALDRALARHGRDARIGIIHHGGDVLPVPRDMR